ncbi:FCD domain-containing protein [Aquitalea sp.]|uniref:FCD domain-containing protein n=2 Tax=Aquitalea TaxID=407217 RepID=UPI00338FB79C
MGWIRLSNPIHVQLVLLAEKNALTEWMNSLYCHRALIIALYDRPGQSSCSFDEHEQILKLLARRDSDGVLHAMQQHLQDCEYHMHFKDRNPQDPWTLFHRQC